MIANIQKCNIKSSIIYLHEKILRIIFHYFFISIENNKRNLNYIKFAYFEFTKLKNF